MIKNNQLKWFLTKSGYTLTMDNSYNIELISASELSDAHRQTWEGIRAANPALYSPYFHPDYAQLVGQLQDDAYIALIHSKDKLIGFLPFQQRQKNKSARPIGAPMTDYHGIISRPEHSISIQDILKPAKISALHMPSQMNHGVHSDDNAITDTASDQNGSGQNVSDQNGSGQSPCAVMRLSEFENPDAWRASRDSSYRRHLKSTRRRIKKTEKEHGKRHFIWQSRERSHFDLLIKWKREKFAETGKYDVLSVDWTLGLLEALWSRGPQAQLRCDLHIMMVDGKPAAMDLGLSDGQTFHSWIVGYDNDLHTLSPGMQLLESLIDQAPDIGYDNIDLGAGLGGYKKHYASWPHMALSRLYTGSGLSAKRAQSYAHLERMGEKSLKDIPGKLRRRYSQISACDPSLSGQARAMWQAVKNGG